MNQQQQITNAVADGIAVNNATGLILWARLHLGFCGALFLAFLVFTGPEGIVKTAPIGIPVTLPGLLGFSNIKKIRKEA